MRTYSYCGHKDVIIVNPGPVLVGGKWNLPRSIQAVGLYIAIMPHDLLEARDMEDGVEF